MRRYVLATTLIAVFAGACSERQPVTAIPEAGPAEDPGVQVDGEAAARKLLASHDATKALAERKNLAADVAIARSLCASALQELEGELARADATNRRAEDLKKRIQARIDAAAAEIADDEANRPTVRQLRYIEQAKGVLLRYRADLEKVAEKQYERAWRIKKLISRVETLQDRLAVLDAAKRMLPPSQPADGVAAARIILASQHHLEKLIGADDLAACVEDRLVHSRTEAELCGASLLRLRRVLQQDDEMRPRMQTRIDEARARLAEARGLPKDDESRAVKIARARDRVRRLKRNWHSLDVVHVKLAENGADIEARTETARAVLRVLDAAKAALDAAPVF